MKQKRRTPDKAFAEALKLYRLDRDWTLENMATETDIPASTLCRIENALVTPTDRTIHKLKKALPGLVQAEVA
jgi:transcriptional regulator with XRE-family HTH domain